ncbi:MAG: hypothetical protein C0469_11395 [Cyanobacteria bacterium DS2.3.42]|nr:hypothetical protein [Cyanobacteria bacterium DS2.3.42]
MLSKKSLMQTALVASSVSMLTAAQPAWSNQWTDMIRNILVPPSGAVYSDSIAERDTQITNRIIDAINANKLSPSDTQSIKVQLDHIKSMEADYRSRRTGGQLGAVELASLNSELNRVEATLNRMIGTNYGGTVTTNIDNTDEGFSDVKRRITSNLSSGRLTIDEARTLKNQYDQAWNDRRSFKADGVLSPDEIRRLNQALDDLKANIASNTRDTQAWPGIDGQQVAQANRIEQGITSGRITRREYEELKAESDRIANFEARARANGLQLDETLTLATDLSNFNLRISSSLNNGNTGGGGYNGGGGNNDNEGRNFDLRQANVLRRIDESAANGRLTAAEADDLRADFRRLEQLETSYRRDGNLTAYELDVLRKGLDSINLELKGNSDPVAIEYPEINRKQQDLKNRINEGVARGRIRGFDAQKLNASLAWIASAEAAFRQSGGRLEKDEADRILADLDRLSAKIDRVATSQLQNLNNRKADLQRKIDEKTASGKLSYRTARSLRRELDRIGTVIQDQGTSGRVRPEVYAQISADMDALNTRITSGLAYSSDSRQDGRGDYRNQRP